MFLSDNYILANELVQKMDIHIANISILKNNLERLNNTKDIISLKKCSFINKDSLMLPNNILVGIFSNEFTDISDKLPVTYVRSEFGITYKELQKSGILLGKVKIAGKQFYHFTPEFVEKMKNKTVYILNKKETLECERNKDIDGYIQLGKNKFLTWY